MTDYVKTTNFTAKDSLPSGNAGKIIKGADFDTEFAAIATAVATKANSNSPTFIGTPAAPTATSGTNTTQLATTAFVTAAVVSGSGLPTTGGTLTGLVNLYTLTNKKVVMSTSAVDLSAGTVFSYTLPSTQTFTFSGTPATSTTSTGFVLELTNGGAFAVTWPAAVKWPSGTAPTLTTAGIDVLVFITLDNGTTWRGAVAIKDSK
jgi:hypothetical protein